MPARNKEVWLWLSIWRCHSSKRLVFRDPTAPVMHRVDMSRTPASYWRGHLAVIWSLITTLNAVRLETRSIPSQSGESCAAWPLFHSLRMISFVLTKFNRMLFFSAQSSTCVSSAIHVSLFSAGKIMYASSANLIRTLASCLGLKSAAVTTYAAGHSPDPWITLACLSAYADTSEYKCKKL